MKLFSKIKDCSSMLEEILDKKYFSSNIKNIILSMIYKLEISYKDYRQVKRVVREKEEFLEELLEIIKKYCDNIKTVEPEKPQAKLLRENNVKALTNEKERSILTYPTEIAMLYAISDISPKFYYIKNSFIFKKAFQKILVEGYNINNLEVLNNFNGWSWDSKVKEDINYVSNIIYQNLLFILGEKFLYNWRTYSSVKRDFLKEMKIYIKSITKNNNYFNSLCKIIQLTSGEKDRLIIDKKLKNSCIELEKMLDEKSYIAEITKKKEDLDVLTEEIQKMLDDEKLIIKEFNKRNKHLPDDKKISNIKVFIGMLEREKQSYIDETTELENLLKPNIFAKKKSELEELNKIWNNENTIEEELINLQKEFLIILKKKIEKTDTPDEIIDIIYALRYYKTINIDKTRTVSDIKEILDLSNIVLRLVITKACKMGILRIISMNIDLNYEIISYALDTKIINLEDIKLYFELEKTNMGDTSLLFTSQKEDANISTNDTSSKQNQVLIIKVFDKEVFEKQGRKEMGDIKKELEVKQKKMIRLFN